MTKGPFIKIQKKNCQVITGHLMTHNIWVWAVSWTRSLGSDSRFPSLALLWVTTYDSGPVLTTHKYPNVRSTKTWAFPTGLPMTWSLCLVTILHYSWCLCHNQDINVSYSTTLITSPSLWLMTIPYDWWGISRSLGSELKSWKSEKKIWGISITPYSYFYVNIWHIHSFLPYLIGLNKY